MTRRLRIVAALTLAVLALAGCSDNAPGSGTVTERDHDPAWMQMIPSGKVWVPIYHPARWKLHIDDGQAAGWVEVSNDAYDRCAVGALYPDCEAAS